MALLPDLFMCAYEWSTKEYLSAKSRMVESDLLRLTYRYAICQTVKAVVQHPEQDLLALVTLELRRLHEGALARYGLRLAELGRWRKIQG